MIKLGFIGAGNMARALACGLVNRRVFRPDQIVAADVDAAARRRFSRACGVKAIADNLAVVDAAPVIVLAVKPQTLDGVLGQIGAALDGTRARGKLFISIAAGVPLTVLETALGQSRVIRVMPNAPAMVGEGMAALVRGRRATAADQALALRLLTAVGDAVVLADEALLDVVTGLSGSGPAYVYLFVKALADAAVAQGLPPRVALPMALKTVRGAEAQMRQSALPADELIRIVASPGGTTEAALRAFAAGNFTAIVSDAVKAAADRSRELGQKR